MKVMRIAQYKNNILLALLVAALFFSAFFWVYLQYMHRQHSMQFEKLRRETMSLQVQYSQLLLEFTALSRRDRVQKFAKRYLGLDFPTERQTTMIAS